MSRKSKHEGKHDDGSFESGEGSAEAILDEQLNKPLPFPEETDAENIREKAPVAEPTRMRTTERDNAMVGEALRGGACPPATNGDKTPEVFEWHCHNSPDAVQRYAGRKVVGVLVTEEFINRVRALGLRDALGDQPMPTPKLADEITDATKAKVAQAEAAEQA